MIKEGEFAPVSVVIPCFRCGKTIGRALASVAQQTQKPAEVILVDDASGDDTWAVLTGLEQAYPGWIKLLRLEENQGAAAARNVGWAVATQAYIAFLDADDAWHPRKIEIQYAYMKNHPEVILCGHGHRVFKQPEMKPDWELHKWFATPIPKWSLLLANKFITPSVMVRRDIRQRFCPGQRYMEDRLLWLEIVCDGCRIDRLGIDLAATYKRPYGADGLSSNLWQMARSDLNNYRLLRARGRLSPLSAYALMTFSLLKFLLRLGRVMRWRIRRDL